MAKKQSQQPEVNISTNKQSGGINVGGSATAGGDMVGGSKHGDTTVVKGVGAGANVAAGRGAGVQSGTFVGDLAQWQAQMEQTIDQDAHLSANEKQALKEQVAKIQQEAAKGDKADIGWLEKLLNTLAPMSGDIFEVVITTLANPLLGIGLVLKKIGDKAKIEKQAKAG
jgi:hypothetical protein